jgi:hypothetical protein
MTMMTKNELNGQLAALAALQTKLATTPLTEQELEVLTELFTAEQARQAHAWRHARAEQAISLLFPTWRGGRIEKPKHPIWHEKSWWWNGASIDSLEELSNGDLEAKLESYVGCGDTDTIYGFIIKKEWLDAEDMPATIKAHCEREAAAREAARVAQEHARAQADLAAAQARLAQLQTGS